MKVNVFKQFGFLALSLAGLLAVNTQAAVIDCPPATLAMVSNTSACQYSDTEDQDFLTDPMTVNTEGFFGASDWSYISKTEYNDNQGQSGTWAIHTSQWSLFDEIMLIFKSGNGTTLVGYLANSGATSGSWDSPFGDPLFSFNNAKDVSHLTYYGRGTPSEIPEPSLLVLLMLGLGSVALGRLRAR